MRDIYDFGYLTIKNKVNEAKLNALFDIKRRQSVIKINNSHLAITNKESK